MIDFVITFVSPVIAAFCFGFVWGWLFGNCQKTDAEWAKGYRDGDRDGWQRGVKDTRQIYRLETARMAAEKCK